MTETEILRTKDEVEAAQYLFDLWKAGATEDADEAAMDAHESCDAGNANDIIEAWLKSLGAK